MGTPTGKIETQKPQDYQLQTIANLIKDGAWNKELAEGTFSGVEAKQILRMPLSMFPRKDMVSGNTQIRSIHSEI